LYFTLGSKRSPGLPVVLPGGPTIPAFSENAVTSGLSVDVSSNGEITFEAKNVPFVDLVQYVFKNLPQIDNAPSRNVNVTGRGVGLNKKVTCRFMGHNQAELIAQLQTIGSCLITVTTDGTKEVITLANRPGIPSPPPSSQSGAP
jgi:hypothetical protein